jgi:hypothetical protein
MRRRRTLEDLWQRGQRGWPESYPVVQAPNAPLAVAVAGLGARVLAPGRAATYAHGAFIAGLSVWSWMELTEGANAVRRVYGAAGLGFVVLQLRAAPQPAGD